MKTLRLVGEKTVEEIILARANEKLRLTSAVIGSGQCGDAVSSSSTSHITDGLGEVRVTFSFIFLLVAYYRNVDSLAFFCDT